MMTDIPGLVYETIMTIIVLVLIALGFIAAAGSFLILVFWILFDDFHSTSIGIVYVSMSVVAGLGWMWFDWK